MPLSTSWQRIFVCETGQAAPQANAILYPNDDIETWVGFLKEAVERGDRVALVGSNAQEVLDRFNTL